MKKVLIANRGEIAVRIIRACRELGIKTTAIHSTADRESLHAKMADESICIGEGPSAKSYLNIPRVMSAVEISGADAIHPGYGFLSENAEFARICQEHKITFIGPLPEHIKKLGDKVTAKKMALEAGLPLLPSSPGAVSSEAEARDHAAKIGFPVIIKASAGGGGRGMKIVEDASALAKQLQVAKREAQIGFGNDACYLEKYLTRPRHIEVQVLGDHHGNYQALGTRDCTIQRRHQKLIEEARSPALNDKEEAYITEKARSFIAVIGYQSLGTIEFLYQDKEFYFLEMNTRVQVEHPVTEEVFNVDLIKEQLRIACGEKLSADVLQPTAHGHSLECRIAAEDPVTFAPCPGKITEYYAPGGAGVRIDSMLYSGYVVPPTYDSMLAKVITKGKNRAESIARMLRALQEMKVDGIKTNIPLHMRLLQDPNFISLNYSTRYLG